MNAEQLRRCLLAHHVRDGSAPVTALRHEVRVSEALHEHDPGAGDAGRVPAGRGRLAGEPVARQRRDHQVEGVRCARAICRGVGERVDDLELLDDRAGPAVGDDERQRIVMARTNVDEMDVESVDLGHEVRQGVQRRLAPAPVVICRPVAREFLNHRERHALRIFGDGLAVGPAGSRDTRTQCLQFRLGNLRDRVRPDRCRARRVPDRDRHADLLGRFDGRYRVALLAGAGHSGRGLVGAALDAGSATAGSLWV